MVGARVTDNPTPASFPVTSPARTGRPKQLGAGTKAGRGRDTVEESRRHRLWLLAGVALITVVLFLTLNVKGSWAFALELRSRKVAAMVLTGYAVAHSTVLFQTITNNRILTPGIMGFDSLYVLIQTVAVFLFGAMAVVSLPAELRFAVELLIMVGLSGLLFRLVLERQARNLYVLLLAGIICGTLFGSLTQLVSRLIDPNEYLTLQDLMFATFSTVNQRLLVITAVTVLVVSATNRRLMRDLDVIALGREEALNLGVDHPHIIRRSLVSVAILVSVSTALVGPITFFGLLVANLARQLLGTFKHRFIIPAATWLSVVALVGGQLILEQLLGFNTALVVIINFLGGLYFLTLLLKEARHD